MIEIEVQIPDSPGALIKLIKPISENAGNIYTILHSHKDKIKGNIPVLVRFELINIDKITALEKIKKELNSLGFLILKTTDVSTFHHMTAILSGHVFRHNFEKIVLRITKTGAKVHDVEVKITSPEDISNVKFLIEIPEDIEDIEVTKELNKISIENDLFLLTEEIL
jgi:ACT domain-containing protein